MNTVIFTTLKVHNTIQLGILCWFCKEKINVKRKCKLWKLVILSKLFKCVSKNTSTQLRRPYRFWPWCLFMINYQEKTTLHNRLYIITLFTDHFQLNVLFRMCYKIPFLCKRCTMHECLITEMYYELCLIIVKLRKEGMF